jgi:hypothetical protein
MTVIQSIEERLAVLDAFEKSQYWPVGLLQTENNINQVRFAIEGKVLSISVLVEVFKRLTQEGRLEFVQKQPEVKTVIEYRVPERTAAQRKYERQVEANKWGLGKDIRIDQDRGDDKPQYSDEDILKEAIKDTHAATMLQEVEDVISRHTGRTHARTQAERSLLRGERDRLLKARVKPEAIRDASWRNGERMETKSRKRIARWIN